MGRSYMEMKESACMSLGRLMLVGVKERRLHEGD
jgi:hypothetical protein